MPRSESPVRVLIVEDEPTLADSIRYNLEREGFEVAIAETGPDAIGKLPSFDPSLLLLDLMLPGMSGLDVCKQVRSRSDIPIIMVTAKDAEADVVAGLELGADDYVTKPFSMRELIARVRAHLRRLGTGPDATEVLEAAGVRLDIGRHEAWVQGTPIELRPKEFELLEAFLRRPNRLLTRDFLAEEVWGPGYFGDMKTLDVHIMRLRRKIERDPAHPEMLLTVRGLGYKFVGG